MLNRRLKHRLPPALKASVKRLPALVIVVSTTLFITPEAWARVQEGSARAMVVTDSGERDLKEGDVFIKHYRKDELGQKVPANPLVGLDQRLADELTGVINRVGANTALYDQSKALGKLQTAQPTEDSWRFHVAAMKDAPASRKADVNGLRAFFAGETQKAATDTAKSRFDLMSKFGAGFKFNLNLKSWFGGKDKTNDQEAVAKEAPKAGGNLRYGLIVEDIVPNMNAPKRAAIGNASAQELQYAGHADVRWTIGPLEETSGRPVFTPVSFPETGGSTMLGGRLRVPSPNFNGTVTPENFENFAKVDSANMPAWRFDLTQEEGLYNMAYRTKTSGERLSVEHLFRVPVAGTIELGRRFSDNWEVVETSVYNILYDKRLPLLSVHYMDVNKRFTADLTKTFGRHSIGAAGRGKALNTKGLKKDEVAETYSINYTNEF